MSALIAALICPGSFRQVFMNMARSGYWGASGVRRASDFAPLPLEIGIFEAVTGGCSCPVRPIIFLLLSYKVYFYAEFRRFTSQRSRNWLCFFK